MSFDPDLLMSELARMQVRLDQAEEARRIQFEALQQGLSAFLPAVSREFAVAHIQHLLAANPHFSRNLVPNDDVLLQRLIEASWAKSAPGPIDARTLLSSGFRVFSQNDEDGQLLRLFHAIGTTNRIVVEIGSNCSGSETGIPENLSTNLIVNHCWFGAIIDVDPTECRKIRHFFARDAGTRHFHYTSGSESSYFSPLILDREVTPGNVNELVSAATREREPDLFVLDTDGGDFEIMRAIEFRPRVIVVEFERRFRAEHAVFQGRREDFCRSWPQSGSVSLSAWEGLFARKGYALVGVCAPGFNALFCRRDVIVDKVRECRIADAFDAVPSLRHAPDAFWLQPDDSWLPYLGQDS